MNNLDLISDLQARRRTIEAGGGESFTKAQHDSGKKTARERLASLFDEGSFVEIDAFFGSSACEGVVCGYGVIDDRLVYAYAQDYSILNGAIGEIHAEKICRIMDMALTNGAPIISIIDSGGVRINEGINALMGAGKILTKTSELSGVVPQITAVMGPCSGALAMAAQSNDFVFATKSSTMFINGPQIIQGITGKDIDLSAEANFEKIGNIHFLCEDDSAALESIRRFVSYLPSNNLEDAPIYDNGDEINRLSEKLTALSNTTSDIREIIFEIVDKGQFTEVSKMYAKNIVIGFARLNGYSVGVVANQPIENDGEIDNNAAKKAARFIRFCDCFKIPLVTLIDVPGFTASDVQEYGGLAQNAAKLAFAYAEASVPKVNIITKRAYGSAYLAMNCSADITIAWPTAIISPMQPDGAAVMLYNHEIAVSSDPVKVREEKTNEYIQKNARPYNSAAEGYIDDIIEPDSTRPRIISALDMLASKRKHKPEKLFGNIPM